MHGRAERIQVHLGFQGVFLSIIMCLFKFSDSIMSAAGHMALPKGRLWAAVLLLGIAIAAELTASALSPQPEPPVRGSSRYKSAHIPQPTHEELSQWDKAIRGLKSITLSPQPEPHVASTGRYRIPWVVRKWRPVAVQASVKNSTAVAAAGRGLKAMTLSPQTEPPRAQRFARWAATTSTPLMKTMPVTGVAPWQLHTVGNSTRKVPVAVAGRGLKGLDGPTHAEVPLDPEDAAERGHDTASSAGAQDALPALGFPGRRLAASFDASVAGKKFRTVSCGSWFSAPDLSWFGRQTRTRSLEWGPGLQTMIDCTSGGGHSRGMDSYHIEVKEVYGKRSADHQPGYYARARISHDGKTQRDQYYCWSRVGSDNDWDLCQCDVVLQGSALGRKSACHCNSP
jgi:hypothetical protein